MGTITRDVELRYLPSGSAVANFSIAINESYKTQNGEKKEEVSYFNMVAFGLTAENINKYFQKGSRILVEAKPKEERWEKDGHKQSKTVFVVENFYFVDRAESSQPKQQPRPQPKPQQEAFDIDESEIPF